jgi:membrane fusion protein
MADLSSLFRPEAVRASGVKLDGDAFVYMPSLIWAPIAVGTLLAVVALIFASRTNFTSWAYSPGALVPDEGLATLPAPRGGRVSAVFVHEGQQVQLGTALIELMPTDGVIEDFDALNRRAALLDEQKTLTSEQLRATERRQQTDLAALEMRRKALNEQRRLIAVGLAAQKRKVALARDEIVQLRRLLESGFLSKRDFAKREAAMLDEEQQMADMAVRSTDIDSQLRDLGTQAERITFDAHERRLALLRQTSDDADRSVLIGATRAYRVNAPISGTVTSVRASVGQAVESGASLVTIIPKGSKLEAVVLVPTKDAAMLAPGLPALIEFAGFPFEQFGRARGKVVQVDRTVVLKGERVGALVADEPSFRTVVTLPDQSVRAYGRRLPLSPGMQLNARIAVRSRSVLARFFEPIEAARPVGADGRPQG